VLIALSANFLQPGIRAYLRDWRIASLVLMLIAVAKVFVVGAAGFDGLLRITSFAASGLHPARDLVVLRALSIQRRRLND
jgi:uncharacterized membrane protein